MVVPGLAQLQQLRPGFNLFSAQQDVQLGQDAEREMQNQMTVLHNREVDAYLGTLLGKLEKSPVRPHVESRRYHEASCSRLRFTRCMTRKSTRSRCLAARCLSIPAQSRRLTTKRNWRV